MIHLLRRKYPPSPRLRWTPAYAKATAGKEEKLQAGKPGGQYLLLHDYEKKIKLYQMNRDMWILKAVLHSK
jgi:hypothetical protein